MEYTYHVPVVVKVFGDEEEESVNTRKSITDFVLLHLPKTPWREFFSTEVQSVRIEALKDRLVVRVSDEEAYSILNDELRKGELQSWCDFGYFENGLELVGGYYGYPQYESVVVYLSDHKLPIVSKTKRVDNERG